MTNRAEWLKQRRQFIGGSDAGAIAGVNPYATALDVYLDKTGEGQEVEDNEPMFWGRVLEDTIAGVFQERQQLKVRRRGTVVASNGFMGANVDRVIVGEDGSDEVPEHYLLQVAHYLAVTGYTWAKLAVLIGGRDFRVYDLPRDDELIDMLTEIEHKFWVEHVEARIPPDPHSLADLNALYRRDDGNDLIATSECQADTLQLKAIKAEIKKLEALGKDCEKRIKTEMGKASRLLDANGLPLATWKTQTSTRLDIKAVRQALGDEARIYEKESESRVFRIKQ